MTFSYDGTTPDVSLCTVFADDKEWYTTGARCGWTPMGIAAQANDIKEMWSILAEDIEKRSLNMGNEAGWTPLFIAVTKGNAEAVKFLLDNGANANVATSSYCSEGAACVTPLDRAYGNPEKNAAIIILLEFHGAKRAPQSLKDEYNAARMRLAKEMAEINGGKHL